MGERRKARANLARLPLETHEGIGARGTLLPP